MSTESVRDLVERMKSDATFRERVAAATDGESREHILAEQGFSLTSEEIEQIRVALDKGQLDDALLEGVAGGVPISPTPVDPIQPPSGEGTLYWV
jgi:predicted ribosomally synthesized peptide with nif11-like leader